MKQMKKKIMTLVLAMSMVLALTACGGSAKFEKGTVEGNVYTNTSVGIKATVPEGLTIADEATMQAFQDTAMATMENAEEVGAAIVYETVITSEAGSSIQIAAEDMTKTIGAKVKADTYLESLQKTTQTTYESMGCTVEFSDVAAKKLGGVEFSHINISIDLAGTAITQECYCRAIGNHMYYIIVTDMGDCTDAMTAFFDSFEAAK